LKAHSLTQEDEVNQAEQHKSQIQRWRGRGIKGGNNNSRTKLLMGLFNFTIKEASLFADMVPSEIEISDLKWLYKSAMKDGRHSVASAASFVSTKYQSALPLMKLGHSLKGALGILARQKQIYRTNENANFYRWLKTCKD
jgi:hypothetical protein